MLVVGSLNTDLVAYAERLPEAGETVMGRSFQAGFGGKGGNQAVMAARLAAQVAMAGAVGEDDYGTAYLANLAAEGVDTGHVTRVAGSSGVAPIWVDDRGSNRIIVVPGANDHVQPELAVRAVQATRPTVVVGQFEIPQAVTTAAFRAARASGATTILNPAPAAPIETDLLAVTDWLVPNETEFALLAGAEPTDADGAPTTAIRDWAAASRLALVVTLGERGVVLVTRDGAVTAVASPRAEAIDTTGAGDAFVGAFAVGLAIGWEPVRAARLGCAAASDSVTRPGTQRSFAGRDEAAAILASIAEEMP